MTFLVFLLGTKHSVSAQVPGTPEKQIFFPLKIGWSWYQARDLYHSPLRYRGAAWTFGSGYEDYGASSYGRSSFNFRTGALNNGAQFPASATLRGGYGGSTQVWKVAAAEELRYFAGFSILFNFSSRARGKGISFDGAVSLALTGAATYRHSPGERWVYDAQLRLPLAAYVFRPHYAAAYYEKKGKASGNFARGLLFFPKYLEADVQLNATWQMNNSNALRIGYQWWYYKMDFVHPVRVLEQGISSTLLTRLKG